MRAVSKQRAFSSVAIITSILFAVNIGAQGQLVTGGGATGAPGGSEACNPSPAKLSVEVKQSDKTDVVTVSPPGGKVIGAYVDNMEGFLLIELGLFQRYLLPPESGKMTEIDTSALQMQGSGLQYVGPGVNPTRSVILVPEIRYEAYLYPKVTAILPDNLVLEYLTLRLIGKDPSGLGPPSIEEIIDPPSAAAQDRAENSVGGKCPSVRQRRPDNPG